MTDSIDALQKALQISRAMLARVDDNDWQGIAELQAQREAFLVKISPVPSQAGLWQELARLNQELVEALQKARHARTMAAAEMQRQRKNANYYQHR